MNALASGLRKGGEMADFRAKTYVNRHGEQKLQVSGSQEGFKALLKGDADKKIEFDAVVKTALGIK